MFDTVGARINGGTFSPKSSSRNAWESITREYTDPRTLERRRSVAHFLKRSEARIAIMADGQILSIECSLPKLIFGNNLRSLYDPAPALARLNEFVPDYVDGPIPDVQQMPFSRVDYCHNFPVGNLLHDYVRALRQIPFLKRRATFDEYDGVEWWGENGRRLRAYNKFQEILHKDRLRLAEAFGILRVELEIRRKAQILQRRLKKKNPTLANVLDLTRAYVTLAETLNKICADLRFVCPDNARKVLDEHFPPMKATRLLGVVHRLQTQSIDELRELLGRSSFFQTKRDLRAVGLWPPAPGEIDLPGLCLPPLEEIQKTSEASA